MRHRPDRQSQITGKTITIGIVLLNLAVFVAVLTLPSLAAQLLPLAIGLLILDVVLFLAI